MYKFIGKSNEHILCKLIKSEILRLYSIVHGAMETTKTWDFTWLSKSFISVLFTCQFSACELQPFSCHDLANDIYSQNAKTVFSHLNSLHVWQSGFRSIQETFVCGIQNPVQGIGNPADDWHPESKFHSQGIRNPITWIRNHQREIQKPKLSVITLNGSIQWKSVSRIKTPVNVRKNGVKWGKRKETVLCLLWR